MGFGDIFGDFAGILDYEGNDHWRDEQRQNAKSLISNHANPGDIKDAGQSAFQNLSTDPRMRDMALKEMSQMDAISNAGGLDPQSLAAMDQAKDMANSDVQARNGALQQNLQARGMGGSGADISGLIAAQQGGANREHMAAVQNGAAARQRSMEAMGNAAHMANDIGDRDWSRAAQRAGALDSNARFNAEQSLGKFDAQERQRMNQMGVQNNYDKIVNGQNAQGAGLWSGFATDIGNVVGMGVGGGGGMGGGAKGQALSQMANYNVEAPRDYGDEAKKNGWY